MKKYGLDKFSVEIIEGDINSIKNLLNREKFWIKELHTCIYDPDCWGYNMTWGGDDTSNLHTHDVVMKRAESDKLNHGGRMAMHSKKSIEAAFEGRVRAFPDTNGASPQFIKAGRDGLISKYGNGGASPQFLSAAHSPEARSKASVSLSITMLFNSIIKYINQLKSSNEDLTYENYLRICGSTDTIGSVHISRVLNKLNLMRMDQRWSQEMTEIFKNL